MRGTENKLWVRMATGRRKGWEEEKEEKSKNKDILKEEVELEQEKQHSRVTWFCGRSG